MVLVKDVSLDLSYQRVVLEEKNEKVGAFINETKRAGKIFTAMSFSEDQNYAMANISNMKLSWKRELLMQDDVTSGASWFWKNYIAKNTCWGARQGFTSEWKNQLLWS